MTRPPRPDPRTTPEDEQPGHRGDAASAQVDDSDEAAGTATGAEERGDAGGQGEGDFELALASSAGRWLMLVAVLGSALVQIEATVVNVALPAIGRSLDADVAALQWVLNGYLLSLAALILVGGSLGDRLGRRRVFVLGTVVFTAASAVCAAAPTAETLIGARAVQGLGAALLTPGSLAMLEALLRPGDRARAIGTWSALGGVAAAVGPLLGGWLVELSWRWVFLVPVPLGVLVAVVGSTRIPESRDRSATGRVDALGATLAATALAALTFALVQASTTSWPVVTAAGVVGAVAAAAFILVERRSPAPMLPMSIFASRQFTVANLLTFVVYAALGGVFFLFVVLLQTALGYSPLLAGAASLPITVLMLALSARAGALAERVGPRLPLTVGPLLIAAGMLLMLRISPGSTYVADVLPAVLVFGLGLAATVAPVTATVLAGADPQHAGVASGVNNAVARTAQLIAIAGLPLAAGLSGSDLADPQALTAAFHRAMVITAALAVCGAALAVVGLPRGVLHGASADRAPATSTAAPAPTSPVVGAAGRAVPLADGGRTAHHTVCGVSGPPPRTSSTSAPGQ